MKRTVAITFAVLSLVFGAASCKKAHEAGNDSMSLPAGGKAGTVSAAPAASSVTAPGAAQ